MYIVRKNKITIINGIIPFHLVEFHCSVSQLTGTDSKAKRDNSDKNLYDVRKKEEFYLPLWRVIHGYPCKNNPKT
jgi:hypothetical protein